MGTFDTLFGARQARPTMAFETARADGAVRRMVELKAEMVELKAENAKLRHELRRVRDELATLRRCLGSDAT